MCRIFDVLRTWLVALDSSRLSVDRAPPHPNPLPHKWWRGSEKAHSARYPVLLPRPLAGEGGGEGGSSHERSDVPYHSPNPNPPFWPRLILEVRPAVLSGKCRSKLQHLTHGSCPSAEPLGSKSSSAVRRTNLQNQVARSAAKGRGQRAAFSLLTFFLHKKKVSRPPGRNPASNTQKIKPIRKSTKEEFTSCPNNDPDN